VQPSRVDPTLLLAIAVGLLVRAAPLVQSDFPINDGGLFASVIDQLAGANLKPPLYLEYNDNSIPFAYPPLALMLGAGLAELGVPTTSILRVMPALIATVLIPAWYFLASELSGRRIAGIAAVIYALVPKSYEWLIAGGGLTRALGLLFAVMALGFAVRYFRKGQILNGAISALSLAAASLAHPEAGAFALGSVCLFAWLARPSWRRLGTICLIAGVALAPWIIRLLYYYGPDPLIGAATSRSGLYRIQALTSILSLSFTREAYIALGSILGAIGLFVAATTGRGWILTWIAISVVLTPAAALTFAMLPFSLAASIALTDFAIPRLSRVAPTAIAIGIAVMVVASLWSPRLADSPLWSLSSDSRAAMEWAEDGLPPNSDVLIVSGSPWGRDAVAEWFPYVSHQRSIATPQGTEFGGPWESVVTLHDESMRCANKTVACLREVLRDNSVEVSLVMLPKGRMPESTGDDCCLALRESLRATASVLYDGPGASVFELPEIH